MTDDYLRFVNGVQALRRTTASLSVGLGGALGVAADPMPHQMATVRRVLGHSEVRHLLSDEVGLGKTVQALMILNALRWQEPTHRTLVIAPDNLVSQWQEECWIRGHVMPAVAGTIASIEHDTSPVTLARPKDLMIVQGEGTRTINADPRIFDLLIIDEPQTMPRETIQLLSQAAEGFRQVLVLSATPRLGDPYWQDTMMRMIEPGATQRARLEGRAFEDILEEREQLALSRMGDSGDQVEWATGFASAAASRRVIRNGRRDWGQYLPQRKNTVIRVKPLMSERLRHEVAAILLDGADIEGGLQGSVWTAARALQRSARAARSVLTELVAQGGDVAKAAEMARLASLEDPGDSRLEALLDILSDEWSEDPDQTVIVVCGDNPTIDMLRGALPRHFPQLADAVSVLRRPATSETDGVANLREIQETLRPLLSGQSRLLLVGDWVQAGLNLHHVSSAIIFFSLPWEIDSIDQLIGRVDRLGAGQMVGGSSRIVKIWRILLEGSQEAAVADLVAALGVFDAPLPPLSPDVLTRVQRALGAAAITRRLPGEVTALGDGGSGLSTCFATTGAHWRDLASQDFGGWRAQTIPEPAMMAELAGPKDTPLRREERALGAWLKTIVKSGDFDVGSRRDNVDGYSFKTLWYHREAARGRASGSPFPLPGVSHESWMSGHLPLIYRRHDISKPPRKSVFTDGGENSARPLHFLDHGSDVHDAIVRGYDAASLNTFGAEVPVVQTSAVLPEGHPAREFGPRVLLTVAMLDPFPDELIPQLWSVEARALRTAATSESQREAFLADRQALNALYRAIQRRVRLEIPAEMLRIGSANTADGWADMPQGQVDLCLRPLTTSTNNAIAKGRRPMSQHIPTDQARAVHSGHIDLIQTLAGQFHQKAIESARPALEELRAQVASNSRDEIWNREFVVERRRETSPGSGPVELWQGQLAAMERALSMTQTNRGEALAFLDLLTQGNVEFPTPEPRSILVSFVSDI